MVSATPMTIPDMNLMLFSLYRNGDDVARSLRQDGDTIRPGFGRNRDNAKAYLPRSLTARFFLARSYYML
jgi:hypothetical protein